MLFGRLADRFGRRPILMIDIALYSALNFFAIAFAPNGAPMERYDEQISARERTSGWLGESKDVLLGIAKDFRNSAP